MTESITLYHLCYSSLEYVGWGVFAWSRGVDHRSIVEKWCKYESRPSFTGSEAVCDRGFRHINDETACIYKTTFDAGKDEFKRSVHLTHALIFDTAHLDEFNADIPGLFDWLERNDVFFDSTAQAFDQWKKSGEDLPPAEIPLKDLRASSEERQNSVTISETLNTYPAGLRSVVAGALSASAFTSDLATRPIIWTGPDNGRNGSGQEWQAVRLMFDMAPIVYRRRFTFSTFRPVQQLEGFQWMGTSTGSSSDLGEAVRSGATVIDLRNRTAIDGMLGSAPKWLTSISSQTAQPVTATRTGKTMKLADSFAPQSDTDLVSGFLPRIHECNRVLSTGEGDNALLFATLSKSARKGQKDLLDALIRFLGRLSLPDHPIADEYPSELIGSFCRVLEDQAPTAFTDERRCRSAATVLVLLVQVALKSRADASELILRAAARPACREAIGPQFLPQLAEFLTNALEKNPTVENLTFITRMMKPWQTAVGPFESVSLNAAVRRLLVRHVDKIPKALATEPDTLVLPYLLDHSPADVAEFESVLAVADKVFQMGGEDCRGHYIRAAFNNIGTPSVLQALFAEYRYLLVRYVSSFRAVLDEIPASLAQRIRDVSGPGTWSSLWDAPDDVYDEPYFRSLNSELMAADDARLSEFGRLYASSGVETLLHRTSTAVKSLRIVSTEELLASVHAIRESAAHGFEQGSDPARHLLFVTALSCRNPESFADENLQKIVGITAELLTSHSGWTGTTQAAWLAELSMRMIQLIDRDLLPRCSEAHLEQLAAVWHEAFASDGAFSATVARHCVLIPWHITPEARSKSSTRSVVLRLAVESFASHPESVPDDSPEEPHSEIEKFMVDTVLASAELRSRLLKRISARLREPDADIELVDWFELEPAQKLLSGFDESQVLENLIKPTVMRARWQITARMADCPSLEKFHRNINSVLEKSFLKFIDSQDHSAGFPKDSDRELRAVLHLMPDDKQTREYFLRCLAVELAHASRKSGLVRCARLSNFYLIQSKDRAGVLDTIGTSGILRLVTALAAEQGFAETPLLKCLGEASGSHADALVGNLSALSLSETVSDEAALTRHLEQRTQIAALVFRNNAECFADFIIGTVDTFDEAAREGRISLDGPWAAAQIVSAYLANGTGSGNWKSRLAVLRKHWPRVSKQCQLSSRWDSFFNPLYDTLSAARTPVTAVIVSLDRRTLKQFRTNGVLYRATRKMLRKKPLRR